MVRSRAVSFVVAAGALAAVASPRAAADVDVEVPLALRATGTLLPAGEVETYRFRATKGTRITFQAAAGKGAHLRFAARVFDGSGAEIVIPSRLRVRTRTRLSVRNLRLPSTGDHRLEISATGTGGYTLTLTGKASPKFGGTLLVPQASTVPFAFSAPPRSRVTLAARAAKGSGATPRFHVLSGDGYNVDLGSEGNRTLHAHTVVLPSIGGAGDLSVDLDSPGGAGRVVVAVTVQPRNLKTFKLDTRGVRRGHPHGGESVIVRTVGASGGAVEITDSQSDLVGAKVTIPPGAMPANTTVTMASAPRVTPPDAGDQSAGPAVFLGPPGTTFGAPVEILLPYDEAQIPVGQSPQDLRVLVLESDGSSSILTPKSVDVLGRAVVVEANGFSTFVAVARTGQQPLGVRPGGDAFWALGLNGSLASDASDDSRSREFSLQVGEVAFRSGGVFELSISERAFSYDNATAPDGDHLSGNLAASTVTNTDTAAWSYGADGQTVLMTDADGTVTLVTSRDGNYLVARGNHPDNPGAESLLLVRKNKDPLTKSSLAGKYHVMFWSIDADDLGQDAGVRPRSARLHGTWTFGADGRFTVTGSQRESRLTGAGNASSRFGTITDSGTFTVEAAGTVVARTPARKGDPATVLRFLPGPGGAVLVGVERDAPGANLQAFVLVRQGAGLGNRTATGAYRGVSFDTEMFPYNVQGTTGPPFVDFTLADFRLTDLEYGLTFDGAGSVTVQQDRHSVQRDTQVAGGRFIENAAGLPLNAQSRIDKFGKLTLTGPEGTGPVGAVTPDGMFGCCVEDVARGREPNSLLFFVKPPPAK